MDFKLTESQKEKLDAILWLTDPMGYRGMGRTYLLSVCFIIHSLKYKTWVTINDHINHPQSKREIIYIIDNLVSQDKNLNLKVKKISNSNNVQIKVEKNISFKGENPYEKFNKN